MDTFYIVLAVLGLFLAGIVKGATGLGYASCALPFLVATLGLKPAMALVLVPAMATNISVAFSTGHVRETTERFAVLYVTMLPGIAIGLYLLFWIRPSVAVSLLGCVMILYSVFALTKPSLVIPSRLQSTLQFPTGLLNGILTGLTGSQVMPLFPYMMGLNLEPARMVQAINLAVMIASLVLACGLALTGVMTTTLLAASFLATLPALAGVAFGTRLRKLLPVAQFRTAVLIVLMLMGLGMLLRA